MTKSNLSLPKLIQSLWESGFFKEMRSLAEVSKELDKLEHNVQSPTLSNALLKLTRNRGGFIIRKKHRNRWHYVQRYPAQEKTTVENRVELFEKYELHPKVIEVAFRQFEDGYFKEAVQNAFVEVVDQVKQKTGHPKNSRGHELDGDDLMNQMLGCDNQDPQVKFNELKTSLDKAEQRGLMYLFKGIIGVRDRKAHLNFIQNDPLKTIEYLSLASLLLRLLDEARIQVKPSATIHS